MASDLASVKQLLEIFPTSRVSQQKLILKLQSIPALVLPGSSTLLASQALEHLPGDGLAKRSVVERVVKLVKEPHIRELLFSVCGTVFELKQKHTEENNRVIEPVIKTIKEVQH